MNTPIHHTRSRFGRQDGQAFVEFAIVLPFLALLVFGVAQFGLLFRDYLAITDAARVAARAAAVERTSGPCAAAETAIQNTVSPGQWADVSSRITCTADGATVGDKFKITIEDTFEWPFPNLFRIPNPTLTASATERME
jgi:Flp pilus assembly protein TadG